ncbi:hypothetical protein ES705_00581 [subsurface metagenome]|nr:hypothetical protein [Clostridia bacterium]
MFRIEVKDVSIYKTYKFYYEAIESGKIDLPLIAECLKELKAQRENIQDEIAHYERMSSQIKPVYITRFMIESYGKEMKEVFVGSNVYEQRNFLKKFIEKIIIHDEKIEIVYYAPGPKSAFSKISDV